MFYFDIYCHFHFYLSLCEFKPEKGVYLSPCFWEPECWNCLIVAVVVALARLKRAQESWWLARRKRTLDNYDPAPAGEYLLLIIGQVCPAIWDHLAVLPAKPTQRAR